MSSKNIDYRSVRNHLADTYIEWLKSRTAKHTAYIVPLEDGLSRLTLGVVVTITDKINELTPHDVIKSIILNVNGIGEIDVKQSKTQYVITGARKDLERIVTTLTEEGFI